MALRFAVGIDLGTSNTALAYADLAASDPGAAVRVFPIPQLVAAGQVAPLPLLPSHLYLPGPHELAEGALRLPWATPGTGAAAEPNAGADAAPAGSIAAAVGAFARDQGARVPGRHVASAKSWLCHPAVDRTAAILPWGAPPEVPRLSPVAASARILAHLRDAWDAAHPDAPLAEQDLVITVPASFDEGARTLTLQAAHAAGLPHPRLLEEPQAAFYDFTRVHRGALDAALAGVRLLLVVDVGGGTTDLTLILAQPGAQEGAAPTLRRLAVGDHLLLGGDNMDLALARRAEAQLAASGGGRKLSAAEWGALVQACRAAKERLLAPDAPETVRIAVPGQGSRLVGGALTTDLSRDEMRSLLLDGFFPAVRPDEAPARGARAAGLAELGLPYAADPAITRHAASFLRRHARTVEEAVGGPGPYTLDAVLFNGGALASPLLADRLAEVLGSLRGAGAGAASLPPLRRLANDAPDLAVARGAATYGLVRRGLGLRIGGGSPRSYYIGIASAAAEPEALCVVPRGSGEGVELDVPDRTFGLVLGRPVRFRLFSASGFRADAVGDLIRLPGAADASAEPVGAEQGEFAELPPLQTVIAGDGAAQAQVRLRSVLTEIGTLEIWCVGAEGQRWKLEFQLRQDAGADAGGAAVSALPRTIGAARETLQLVFGKKPQPVAGRDVKDLWRNLEKALGERQTWTLAVDRDLWGVLWAGAGKRRRSADHERMFLALCGFFLRPGFGAPLDAWRVEQTWTLFAQGLTHHREAPVWAAWWILWRRVAAGLGDAEHRALFEAIAPHLKPPSSKRVANPGKKPPGLAPDEMVRLAGALERLPPALKAEAGGWLLERLSAGPAPGVAWALGRLGARVPLAGAAHAAVHPDLAAAWLEALLPLDFARHTEAPFAIAQLARLSGDRARDLDPALRERAALRLEKSGAPPAWAAGVREVQALAAVDAQRVFGEALPLGLQLAD